MEGDLVSKPGFRQKIFRNFPMKPKRCRLKKEAQEARGKTGLMAAGKAVDMPES